MHFKRCSVCFLWQLLVPNKNVSVNQSIHEALVLGVSLQCDISTSAEDQNTSYNIIYRLQCAKAQRKWT